MKIRINKYLASKGIASRRKIDEMIAQQKIIVNGKPAELGCEVDPDKDSIKISNKLVSKQTEVLEYWALNKPFKVLTTLNDPFGRKTVKDFLPKNKHLHPIGRLDYETTGLLLLSNDGELTNILTHPKHHIPKTYELVIKEMLNQQQLKALRNGIYLEDGKTQPALVNNIRETNKETSLELTIFEGRNRQIRRMCKKLGIELLRLKRIKIGMIELAELKEGQGRPLDIEEINYLKSLTNL